MTVAVLSAIGHRQRLRPVSILILELLGIYRKVGLALEHGELEQRWACLFVHEHVYMYVLKGLSYVSVTCARTASVCKWRRRGSRLTNSDPVTLV